jgi:hypothetical protein
VKLAPDWYDPLTHCSECRQQFVATSKDWIACPNAHGGLKPRQTEKFIRERFHAWLLVHAPRADKIESGRWSGHFVIGGNVDGPAYRIDLAQNQARTVMAYVPVEMDRDYPEDSVVAKLTIRVRKADKVVLRVFVPEKR